MFAIIIAKITITMMFIMIRKLFEQVFQEYGRLDAQSFKLSRNELLHRSSNS